MLTFEEFRDRAFKYALDNGCGAAETYFTSGSAFEATALDGCVDKYAVSRRFGLNLRVQLCGKNGYAYTEVLDEPEELARRAMDNAASIQDADEQPMQGPSEYREVTPPASPMDSMTEREKIELALRLEKAVLARDSRVKRVMYCSAETGSGEVKLHNTLGLRAEKKSKFALCFVEAVMEQDGVVKDGVGIVSGPEACDIEKCAAQAVAEAALRFGASPVSAGKYRILIRNDAMAELLSAFSSIFSAEDAQKGRSLMAGKEGKRVAADMVNIVDDPFYPADPMAFDAEGVPAQVTDVIKGGVLTSLLHDLKTAKKAGVKSTGNAVRPGAASPVTVGPTNLYIVPGEKSYDELVEALHDGLIINSMEGMHAGLDPVSGEFSLLARGQLVKEGKVVRSVDQITVGGSFIDMMEQVEAVGADMWFVPGLSDCGSPSVLVSGLMVAGD